MPTIDTAHLARLAALALTKEEVSAAQGDLERIIEMIDEMQTVDTEGVAPMAHPLDGHQRLRADEVTETVERERFQSLAPSASDGFYLVPRVVE